MRIATDHTLCIAEVSSMADDLGSCCRAGPEEQVAQRRHKDVMVDQFIDIRSVLNILCKHLHQLGILGRAGVTSESLRMFLWMGSC